MPQIETSEITLSHDGESETVVILGGGVTGLSLAWDLLQTSSFKVIIVEKATEIGGAIRGISYQGKTLDLGSHRINATYDRKSFQKIKALLEGDLLERPRNGAIRIQNRFLSYPPSAWQILRSFEAKLAWRIVWDYLRAQVRGLIRSKRGRNFGEHVDGAVGKSLYQLFYSPYAKKLWNVPPERVSYESAQARVKKFALPNVTKSLFKRSAFSPIKKFHYPKFGFTQIGESLASRVSALGGKILTDAEVVGLTKNQNGLITSVKISYRGSEFVFKDPSIVVSTLPLEKNYKLLTTRQAPPLSLKWRSLRVLYFVTSRKIHSEHETYYFPEDNVIFGRVSEPCKYSPVFSLENGKTILVIEVPCSVGDCIWSMEERKLLDLCVNDLVRLGILKPATGHEPAGEEVIAVSSKNHYPVYELGWREQKERAFHSVSETQNFYPVGRPALFLHCNVDHCLIMAFELSQFLQQKERLPRTWVERSEKFYEFAIHD